MKIVQSLKSILLRSSLFTMVAQPVDVRAFEAIDYLSQLLFDQDHAFSILDLGCAGGATNAWSANWSNYEWLGIDAKPEEIMRLQPLLPEKSELHQGYVYSEKFCQHNLPSDGSLLEIGEILKLNSFDFVKIDIDGCDLHILEGIFESAGSSSILGLEIEVTYSSVGGSEINFDRCASLLIAHGFEPIAIESPRRYASSVLPSPYVWEIQAQTAMGIVFQGNQTWLRNLKSKDFRSSMVSSLILAAYGLSDWSWQIYKDSMAETTSSKSGIDSMDLRSLFIPSFLRGFTSKTYDREFSTSFKYSKKFRKWRLQSQFRETEQPWFLSN